MYTVYALERVHLLCTIYDTKSLQFYKKEKKLISNILVLFPSFCICPEIHFFDGTILLSYFIIISVEILTLLDSFLSQLYTVFFLSSFNEQVVQDRRLG